ncbi:MAG: (d)CMP kinase, partial [Erysipelotrichaceae bacterium]|nr:(d)CMP kinase [Erysipelotrichaceae bacterium]
LQPGPQAGEPGGDHSLVERVAPGDMDRMPVLERAFALLGGEHHAEARRVHASGDGRAVFLQRDGDVLLDGEDITEAIRANEISMGASEVSKLQGCREALVAMQQKFCENGGYILDGRDIGTVVLKDAPVKIYLTATPEARAMRRVKQNLEKGLEADYETILEDIIKRDYQDMHREYSPLTKAEDAIEIDTSDLSIDEVVERCMELVNEVLGE